MRGLQYKTAADAVGTGNITSTVQDSGGTAYGGVDPLTESLSVTVSVVNDQPVHTAGSISPINVEEDSANTAAVSLGLSYLSYATGNTADEVGQSLAYTITAIPACVALWLIQGFQLSQFGDAGPANFFFQRQNVCSKSALRYTP